MKMLKGFLLLVFLMPAVAQAQFEYTNKNGTITITKYTGADKTVVFPSTIDGLPVTSIGDYVVWGNFDLTSVVIPDSVICIDDWAFDYSYSLANVTIGNRVTTIGDYAFHRCGSLPSIKLPDSVTRIGRYAFGSCVSLTNIIIGSKVATIGDWAFRDCSRLTRIMIPNSLRNIGFATFFNCSALEGFYVDALNPAYSSMDGVLFNNDQTSLIYYPGAKGGSYTIPDTVTSIGGWAFACCTSLTNLTIGNRITKIGQSAFFGCIQLANMTIPDSVSSIEPYTFQRCANLTNVTMPNSITSIEAGTFQECVSLTSVAIPNNVTSIGSGTFYSCSNLISLIIPANVTTIDSLAFCDCVKLTGLYFRGNAPSVGVMLFVGDDKTTVYYLPGTTGWGLTFAGRPTSLWRPQILTSDCSVGVKTNQFSFTIDWANDQTVVVETTTNLNDSSWLPVATNTLVDGVSYYSDPEWMNYHGRLYRLRSP